MKKIMLVFTLLASSLAVSQQVRVTGTGATIDQAKLNAIQVASERYCGTSVLSDRVHKNNSTTFNQLAVYNSCFLTNLNTIEVSNTPNSVKVTLELQLKPTNQSARLNIRSGVDSYLNGEDASLIINRIKTQDNDAKNYLKHFLSDYPYNAYSIINDVKEPYFHYNKNTNEPWLIVPYSFKGNENYFKALETTLLKFGRKRTYWGEFLQTDHMGRPLSNFDEIDRQITVDKSKIIISDRSNYNLIVNTITLKQPVLKLEIYDTSGRLVKTLFSEMLHVIRLPALGGNLKLNYSVSNTHSYLYAGDTLPRQFQLELKLSDYGLQPADLGSVQSYIIARNDCNCTRFITSQTYN